MKKKFIIKESIMFYTKLKIKICTYSMTGDNYKISIQIATENMFIMILSIRFRKGKIENDWK